MNPLSIEIKRISVEQSAELTILLQSSDKEYSQYFIPFSFDMQTIFKILSKAVKDHFYGVFVDNNLVGFYMLRGFDEGY